jgi:hypothetical protein
VRRRRDELLETRRRNESAARRRRRDLTPEERARALEEMEASAREYERHRSGKMIRSSNDEGGEGIREPQLQPRPAAFLSDVRRKAYGVEGGGASMEERLRQSRNSRQRSHDAGFL